MVKRIKMVTGVLLIVLLAASTAGAAALPDISGHWAEDDIRELVAVGAITGYPDGLYRPEGTITRAEFSSVLRGALGLAEVPGTYFSDIIGHWGEGRIEALIRAGIIDTHLYGQHYHPDGPITREEIAMMTVRMLGNITGATDIPFFDKNHIGTGYNTYVAEAYDRGIIRGYPDGTFRPKGTATRAEAAVMAIRALRIHGVMDKEPVVVDEEPVVVDEEPPVEPVPATDPVIHYFTSDKSTIIAGETVTLSWEVSDAVVVAINPPGAEVFPSGALAVSPDQTTTYTLTAFNSGGSTVAQVTITVTPPFEGWKPPELFIPGLTAPVITTFTADNRFIKTGESTALSWEVKGAATVTITPDIGTVDPSGTLSLSPADTTTYTLAAANLIGSDTKKVKIVVEKTLVIQPGPGEGADVFISRNDEDRNYYDGSALVIGRTPGHFTKTGRSLLAFRELGRVNYGLPPNATITSAHLLLYADAKLGDENIRTVHVHRITDRWVRTGVTWNNAPGFDATPASSLQINFRRSTWLSWDITNLVEGWVDGSVPNHGVLLKRTNDGSGDFMLWLYNSRYTPDPNLRPKLEITYYVL